MVLGQMGVLEVSSHVKTFHGYCGHLDAWAGVAQHMIIGLGLALTLYKPHYSNFFTFFFFSFFTFCLVFRSQLMSSNPYYFCL